MPKVSVARWFTPALILNCLVVMCAVGVAEGAAAGRAVFGLQDDYLSSARVDEVGHRLDALEASGATVSRVDVLWRDVAPTPPARPEDPDDPAYDWSRIDAVVRGLEDRDIDALLTAYSTPPWATDRDAPAGSAVNPGLPNVAAYARFMQALATRYGGRHVPPGATGRLPEARVIEIWNEPNLERFLAPQWNAGKAVARTRYIQMLRAAYPRIKRGNRRAIVLAGAGGPRSSTSQTGIAAYEWLRGIAASGARFDAYSQHVYPAVGPAKGTRGFPAWRTLPFALRELDRHRAHRGKPLYVTEAGYTTLPTALRKVVFSEAQQAAFLRGITRTPVLRSGRVPLVIWFNLQDNPDWPGGLWRGDGTRKLSWSRFGSVVRRGPTPAPGARRTRSARQLLIDQRISQTALRRVAAIERRLARLTARDLRPGGLSAEVFDASVAVSGRPDLGGSTPATNRRIAFPRAPRARAVRPLAPAAQARVNLRIARTALRRSMALERRLAGGLTGRDVPSGAVTAAALAKGLTAAPIASGRLTEEGPARRSTGGNLGFWRRQADGQRVGQEAIRRTARVTGALERGLATHHFQPGALSARHLAG